MCPFFDGSTASVLAIMAPKALSFTFTTRVITIIQTTSVKDVSELRSPFFGVSTPFLPPTPSSSSSHKKGWKKEGMSRRKPQHFVK